MTVFNFSQQNTTKTGVSEAHMCQRQVIHPIYFFRFCSKKPLTRISKPVPGVHGKRGLERRWQKRLAKGWRRVGKGLAKGWQRVGGFPCTLQFRNSRGTRLETRVCDPMVVVTPKCMRAGFSGVPHVNPRILKNTDKGVSRGSEKGS